MLDPTVLLVGLSCTIPRENKQCAYEFLYGIKQNFISMMAQSLFKLREFGKNFRRVWIIIFARTEGVSQMYYKVYNCMNKLMVEICFL